jgi:hypothetical protein
MDKDKILEEQQKIIDQLSAQLKAKDEDIATKDNEILAAQAVVKRLEEEKQMLDTLVDSIQEKHRENLQAMAELNLTVMQLEHERDELQRVNDELQRKISQNHSNYNELKKSTKKSEYFLKLISEETKLEYDTLKTNYEVSQTGRNLIDILES